MQRLFAEITARTGDETALEEVLLLCLLRATGCHRLVRTAPVRYSPTIALAKEYLDDAPEENLLDMLAALCGMSRFQLIRGFARETGITPHAYLVQSGTAGASAVKRRACPADAAQMAGFADQSHLTRAFQKTVRHHPGQLSLRPLTSPAILFKTRPRCGEILSATDFSHRNTAMSFISPEFLLTSLLVVLAPGTGTLYTIATGLSAGRSRSFAAAFGCTLGIIPHLLAAVTLAALLHRTRNSSARSNISVWRLLYMAWTTFAQRGELTPERRDEAGSPLKIITHAVLINLLNPKLPLFFRLSAAVYPQRCRLPGASDADAERDFYADDASGLYVVRRLRGRDARLCADPSQGVAGLRVALPPVSSALASSWY